MNSILEDDIIFSDMSEIYSRDIGWNKLDGKNIIITGGYGMIASYLAYYLIYLNEYKGYNINIYIMIHNKDKAYKCFGSYCNMSYMHIITDSILEPISVEAPIHYIIHAASLASPNYYSICPAQVAEPNAIGTYYLLELARNNPIEGFLLFSSCEVYGKMESESNITERDMGIINPAKYDSCYAESKRMAENWCTIYSHQYGIPTKIARIAHTYSPTMNTESDSRVFASFVNNILNEEDIVMLSDGSVNRAFCYVADAIVGFFVILFKGTSGEVYNVCNTDEFISIKELAYTLVDIYTERRLKVVTKVRDVADSYVTSKVNTDNKPTCDKLKALGWSCKYSVGEGFRRVIEYKRRLYNRKEER